MKKTLLTLLFISNLIKCEKIILKNNSGTAIYYVYVFSVQNKDVPSTYGLLQNDQKTIIDTDKERLYNLPIKKINIFSDNTVFVKTYSSELYVNTKFYDGYKEENGKFVPLNKDADDGIRNFTITRDCSNNLKFQESCCCCVIL